MKSVYAFLILSILTCSLLTATNYYVAKTGDDNHPGTETMPFLTINQAALVMMAGDTCFIAEGIYEEGISVPNDGLTFKAAKGARVEFRPIHV